MDFDSIIREMKKKTKMDDSEINKKILEKQQELSNLVSKEGAAYIVAKELGLDIFPKTRRRLEIKNILPKLRSLNLEARIVRIYPVREFNSKGRTGKVASLILGDETGTVRLSLWDEQTNLIDKLEVDQPIEVFGAYTKEGMGGIELRLSKKGGVKMLEDSDIPSVNEIENSIEASSTIAGLKDGAAGDVRAAVVQLFETSVFYEVCPTCRKRLTKEGDKYKCAEHGVVEPEYTVVLSGVIDDGTSNIRVVFFRDSALKLIGMTMENALKIRDSFFEHIDLLGKEFNFSGKVRKNAAFNRTEFVVNDVREVDVEKEAKKIINNLKANV